MCDRACGISNFDTGINGNFGNYTDAWYIFGDYHNTEFEVNLYKTVFLNSGKLNNCFLMNCGIISKLQFDPTL